MSHKIGVQLIFFRIIVEAFFIIVLGRDRGSGGERRSRVQSGEAADRESMAETGIGKHNKTVRAKVMKFY